MKFIVEIKSKRIAKQHIGSDDFKPISKELEGHELYLAINEYLGADRFETTKLSVVKVNETSEI